MKIKDSSDLIFWTYYMVDWEKTAQTQSDVKCLQCGELMDKAEPVTDNKGVSYEGLVCHNCKKVLWIRSS